MKKVLFAMTALTVVLTANASVTTSIDGGTSFIHLGKLSAKECDAFVGSPASAGLLLAFDGQARSFKRARACATRACDSISLRWTL